MIFDTFRGIEIKNQHLGPLTPSSLHYSFAHTGLVVHLATHARLFTHSPRLISLLLGAGHRPHFTTSLDELLHRVAFTLGPSCTTLSSILDTLISMLANHGLLGDTICALACMRQLWVPTKTHA
jgi:pentatricopeptide repeat domain-containing protein 1